MKKILIGLSATLVLSFLIYLVVKHFNKNKNGVEKDSLIKPKEIMDKKKFNEKDGEIAVKEIQKIYGDDMAKIIEKIMRLETAHFKSGQYKLTGSAGMEVGNWHNIPDGATVGYIEIDDVHKVGLEKFIVWKSVTDFAKYLAEYIKRYKGNFARWNALDINLQTAYRQKVNSIKNRFIV